MGLYTSLAECVGNTPLLQANNLQKSENLTCRLLLKLEGFNPGGSCKDRAALSMIQAAEEAGLLQPGAVIIEPTSGNTGIGLAWVARSRGYRAVIVMPDSMSPERRQLMESYGAKVVLTPGRLGMSGAVAEAQRLAKETPGSFIPDQFGNPANPLAHYRTTGPEIWKDSDGQVDILVAGVGTGGTITGTGRFLREKNPHIFIAAAEPADSPLLSQGKTGPHGLQGMGPNFLPGILDTKIYDRVIPVTQIQAEDTARLLAREEGVLAGISSGAALYAALSLGKLPENAEKTMVVILPDSGERYLSMGLFQPEHRGNS